MIYTRIDIDGNRGWTCSECRILQFPIRRDSMFIVRKEDRICLLCPMCNNLDKLEKILEEKEASMTD